MGMETDHGHRPNTQDPPGWIRYGEGPAQLLHPDTAAQVLALMWRKDMYAMAGLIAEATTGRPYTARRPHRPADAEDPQ